MKIIFLAKQIIIKVFSSSFFINDHNNEHAWWLLLVLCVHFCISSWVFMHEKGYQQRDTGIESAVMTKVKGLGRFNNRVMDVADYVAPSQVSKFTFLNAELWNHSPCLSVKSWSWEVNISAHYFRVVLRSLSSPAWSSQPTRSKDDALRWHKPRLTWYALLCILTQALTLYSSLVCQTDHKFKCTTDDDCMKKLGSNLGNGEFIVF